MCVNVFPASISVHHLCAWFPWKPKKGHQVSWNWYYRLSKTTVWMLGIDSGFSGGLNCYWAIFPDPVDFFLVIPSLVHFSLSPSTASIKEIIASAKHPVSLLISSSWHTRMKLSKSLYLLKTRTPQAPNVWLLFPFVVLASGFLCPYSIGFCQWLLRSSLKGRKLFLWLFLFPAWALSSIDSIVLIQPIIWYYNPHLFSRMYIKKTPLFSTWHQVLKPCPWFFMLVAEASHFLVLKSDIVILQYHK